MNTDMTEGNPTSLLWKYTFPMLLSVAFQQIYTIADSVIAGRFAGEAALASVGASFPITMLFMAVAVGVNIGCSVVVSQLFGAKKQGPLKTAITTSVIATILLSLFLTIVGLFLSPFFMKLLQTPSDIFSDSLVYLRIYILGLFFLFLYNICNGIFNALGDSQTPLYLLIGSSIVNVVLDIVFIVYCGWGVAGVAWATLIAQGLSGILAFILLYKRVDLGKVEEKFSFAMLKVIGKMAIPSILQQSFISVGNFLVQSVVNGYGFSVIAGYSAAVRLNTFATTCFTTLGNSLSGYVAQNFGAGKVERIQKGYRSALFLMLFVVVFFTGSYLLFSENLIGLFLKNGSDSALRAGNTFLKVVSPFFFFVCLKLVTDGFLRGAGAMKPFMISTFTDLILRVILAFAMGTQSSVINQRFSLNETGIWLSWPLGWVVAAILALYFYKKGVWKKG